MDKVGEQTLNMLKFAGWYNDWLFSLVEKHLTGEILEVGAGIGTFTLLLAKKGEVTAIDINDDYIKRLEKLMGKKGAVGFGNVAKGKYFFGQKKFNTVVCLNVLEHIKGDKAALKNMYRLLASGGKLILLVPAHEVAYGTLDENLGHLRRYAKKSVSKLLRNAGFTLIKVRYLNLLGVIGWLVNGKILKRKILPKNQLVIFDKLARPELMFEKIIEPPFGLSVLAIVERK